MVTRRTRFALRWRRAGLGIRLSMLLAGAAVFGLLVYLQRPADEGEWLGNNLLFFLLVNLLIVILLVLVFLVGRNVVKLIFDRRRRILGSKLRMRLVVAFVGLTLVPTTLLFILASDLINRAMEGWFSTQVEQSVEGAVEVARGHYTWLKEYVRGAAEREGSVVAGSPGLVRDPRALRTRFEQERTDRQLFGLRLLTAAGETVTEASHAVSGIEGFVEPPPAPEAIQRAVTGESVSTYEEQAGGQYVRSYVPVDVEGRRYVLLATARVTPELTHAFTAVNDSFREYEHLRSFRRPLRVSYLLLLFMITLLILFAAIWLAFYLAKELVVPIQRLAEGTEAVARGDYDFQIKASGDDEIGFLVRSFNRMISDLRESRREGERRRLFSETILSNLAVGVIALDRDRRVTAINGPALRIFTFGSEERVMGRDLAAVLSAQSVAALQPLLEAISGRERDGQLASDVAEREIVLESQGRELRLVCTAGRIIDGDGVLLLFDDVTELAKAQQMAAWRDVAQRIAHEIKNPLTPIQLSAQRLQKLLRGHESTPAITESVQSIVENVDSIKRLANEFSHFARMPTAQFTLADLNALAGDVISPFAESHSGVTFQFIPDARLPDVSLDREQIRRILINLIDNALAACGESPPSGEGPRIVVRTDFDRRRQLALIEVADNGPGVGANEKTRIFEPYFTTKQGGTGLGLAIVTSIVADHQGYLRVYDNAPRGARFVVELPVRQGAVTRRRLTPEG